MEEACLRIWPIHEWLGPPATITRGAGAELSKIWSYSADSHYLFSAANPIEPAEFHIPVSQKGRSSEKYADAGERMMSQNKTNNPTRLVILGLLVSAAIAPSLGCQVSIAGQTLPSPYYLTDDVQYFPAGPQNKLANETAALEKARAEAMRKSR